MATIDDQAATWMVLRSERELGAAELQEFEAWYQADIRHQGAYLRAMAVNNALNRATMQHDLRPQASSAVPSYDAPRRWRSAMAAVGGVAAALLVAVAVFLAPKGATKVELATAKGELRQFQLADQSVASLNSGSEVEVTLTDTARQVRLKQGEAWFQVAKDKRKPFVVEAGEIRVRAVGTAFSVRRYKQGADVLVTEGVVEVWSNKGAGYRTLVSQGEQIFIPESASDIKAMRLPGEIERKLAWRTGKVVFTNQTLGEAVADFNRYSPRKIIIVDPELMRMKFIGQYSVDAPEIFAKDVSTYLNVPLVITADAIMIGQAKPAPGRPQSKEIR
ncbi:FecR family protein [Duganella aceris]|jgi:transmembrane sensor|uniref:DUF4880 domain-containing protein n=1 Tax=Duganella aceris TaxID=2703883 RepID=A0ABX0FNK6_9BURK|nr:FecR domain-containing protein [Duganella aceris]NGZ86193.1 DUF4880 domain-containing protein [Duganella aceris]